MRGRSSPSARAPVSASARGCAGFARTRSPPPEARHRSNQGSSWLSILSRCGGKATRGGEGIRRRPAFCEAEDDMPHWTRRLLPIALTTLAALPLAGCQTAKGATWPAFGTYRLPYADGTEVTVNNDFITHDPDGRYDLKGHGG